MAPSLSITASDVNRDGVVNVIDLALVALRFGQIGPIDADVNGDGVVDIEDLIQVAGVIDSAAQAPQARRFVFTTITPADVQRWIDQAEAFKLHRRHDTTGYSIPRTVPCCVDSESDNSTP